MDLIYLKSILHYDPETGVFTWLVSRGRMVRPGSTAGSSGKKGIRIVIDGKPYWAHRLAWFYMKGQWPDDQIDHADLDHWNNRIGNLREATNGQNQANKRRNKNNRCGYKGVRFVPRLGKWVAQITHHRNVIHIGCFTDPASAHAAYIRKATELHGEFARAA